jgi:hypothetical protein
MHIHHPNKGEESYKKKTRKSKRKGLQV